MDISLLQTFRSAAESGSISKAAQMLNYAQSNVTAKIKQLEAELQTPLFYRHNRGITLTPAGQTLLTYAEQVLRLLDEARKAVRDTDSPAGPLSVGSMETAAAVRLPAFLANYHRQYPNVDLILKTGPTEELIEAVLSYALEGAFVAGPVRHPELMQERVVEERLVMVTAASQTSTTSADLARTRAILVFRGGCTYRAVLKHWLLEEGIVPVKIMEFGNLDAILGCVAAGLGVSLLPESLAASKASAEGLIRIHAIPERHRTVETVFIYRKDAYYSPAFQAFVAAFKTHSF
ncbi:LysR family transcriptional regulator [Paenibacillus validus]|uniref:LysR family transcriptional regulator n=1 Tax=Paenibacillus validus TaxID=44253 RepID=A0A7X2Z8A7_9BACL|nr:LysR family transcriptional regulator [Paenibacillus validus]MUG69533.1 LysR family transcriptional regulator [Paenibacillus validus]